MQANNIYKGLVNDVVNEIKKIEKEIIILIPPGSSRGEIVSNLVKELQGVEILAYKDLHNKLTEKVNSTNIKAIESSSEGFKVDDKDLVDYIKINNKLSSGLERGNKIIVTKSTFEAILIYQKLYEELVNELKGEGKGEKEANKEAKDRLNNHIEIFFLPKHYEENLKQKDKALYERSEDVISVNYDNEDILKILGVKELKGVSLKLLENINNQWDYIKVKEGVEAIRALGPERVGFADRIRNIAKATGIALGATLGGLVLTTAISAILALLYSAPGLVSIKEKASEFLGKLSSPVINFITKDSVSKFAEKTIEEIGKKGEPRNNTLGALMSLLKAVMMANQYMEDDRFETIIDEVASSWGLDVDTFKKFINNLYAIATQRIVTEEELKKLRTLSDEEFKKNLEKLFNEKWSEVRNEIEKRLDRIEEEIKSLRESNGIYVEPSALGFNLKEGTFRVGKVLATYKFVKFSKIEEYSEELSKRIERREFIVITGQKGVGKSVLTRYALAKMLENGSYAVYEVKDKEDLDENKLGTVLNLIFGRSLITLYDPSLPRYYEPGIPETSEFKKVIDTVDKLSWLYNYLKNISSVAVVVVLPSDVLKAISSVIDLEKQYPQIKINLRDENFLAEIVKAYSDEECHEELYKRIGKVIAEKYEGGYTLIARYAGDWLKRSKCAADIEKAVKFGAGSAEVFFAQYIVKNILTSKRITKELAIPFFVRAALGPLPPKWLEEFPIVTSKGVKCYADPLEDLPDDESNFIRSWLSQDHEDIVEGVIQSIALGELSKRINELSSDTVHQRLARIIKQREVQLKKVLGLLEKANITEKCKGRDSVEIFFNFLANNEEFRNAVKEHKEDFVFAVGVAYTPYLLEIIGKNQLTDWITLGESIPNSVRKFLRSKATAFNDIVKPAEIIKKVFDRCKKKKRDDWKSRISALGAFVISDGKLNTYLEEASALLCSAFMYTIIDIDNLLKNRLMTFIEHLVKREYLEHASIFAYHISYGHPRLGKEILKILLVYEIVRVRYGKEMLFPEIIGLKGDISKLNWVARLYYEMASYETDLGNLHLINLWISRVRSLLQNIKSCNDASCLYMKARLGSRLAIFLSRIGEIKEAKEWMDEAINAVKELIKRNDLAKELETLLKYKYIFSEPSEAIKEELLNLNKEIFGGAALFYLQFDLNSALKYFEDYNSLATRLGDSPSNVPNIIWSSSLLIPYTKVLFLKGHENEAFNILRKNIDIALLLNNRDAPIYVMKYIVSFLAIGKIKEAFEKYKKYDLVVKLVPAYYVMLSTLLCIYGFNVEDDLEKYRHKLLVQYAQDFPKLRAAIGPLENLYGFRRENEACKDLIGKQYNLCKEILIYSQQSEQLRELLIKKGLVEYELVEGIVNPLEMLEITVSAPDVYATFIVILHFIANNKFELARRLAMYWRKELEKRDMKVPASLFGELAKSLEKGSCDDNCRRALLKLFFSLLS